MKSKFLWLVTCGLLLIYSFSQVDLNLTLSSNSIYQSLQHQLTYLGYFNRPFSTAIYVFLILLLAIGYTLLTNFRHVWLAIALTVLVLLPSYPAFSHDIFNYMFDARIVTKYQLSPWSYKALDFPDDTWIRFMRWTHRPTVYPPVWIGLSLIPSILGLGKFTLTLLLFKAVAAGFYVGCCKLISKLNPHALSLFAFNPLVIIETLVNGHMEIAMAFFGLLAIYLIRRKLARWVSFITSIGIKYMTVFLLPAMINQKYLRQSIWLGIVLLIAWVIYYGFQPWYLLWVLPFSYLLSLKSWEVKILSLASIIALFWNVPFIYGLKPW